MPADFVHLNEMCLKCAAAVAAAAACSIAQQKVQGRLEVDWLLKALCLHCLEPAVAKSLQTDLTSFLACRRL